MYFAIADLAGKNSKELFEIKIYFGKIRNIFKGKSAMGTKKEFLK